MNSFFYKLIDSVIFWGVLLILNFLSINASKETMVSQSVSYSLAFVGVVTTIGINYFLKRARDKDVKWLYFLGESIVVFFVFLSLLPYGLNYIVKTEESKRYMLNQDQFDVEYRSEYTYETRDGEMYGKAAVYTFKLKGIPFKELEHKVIHNPKITFEIYRGFLGWDVIQNIQVQ